MRKVDPNRWSETEFNCRLRAAFGAQGYNARHIVETDLPGFADILVWRRTAHRLRFSEIRFIECKLVDTVVRAGQREFMRDTWEEGQNSYWAVYDQGRIYWQPGFFMPMSHNDWFEHASEGLVQPFSVEVPASSFSEVFKFLHTKYGVSAHGH